MLIEQQGKEESDEGGSGSPCPHPTGSDPWMRVVAGSKSLLVKKATGVPGPSTCLEREKGGKVI